MEFLIIFLIIIFVFSYRKQNGANVSNFITGTFKKAYNKYAPYSFEVVRQKTKELGKEYTAKEYVTQIVLIGGLYAVVAYAYFYSVLWAIIYFAAAVMVIPYLAYLRNNKAYSEYIFEQIQVYCTNVINEFNTTQSFVKSLEGVVESGILEEPILSDVKLMIQMSYKNGTIDEAIDMFNKKYPYYMVKNMHQLFAQITKEGAKDTGESLELMMNDIDVLVEGVYRDKMDRQGSHKKFIGFGIALFFLAVLVQYLMSDNYKSLLNQWYFNALLHIIIIVNSYFLLSGEKFYNQDTGVE